MNNTTAISAEKRNNCKVVSVANQKGGVAKTTTAVNLGIGLAREGRRVLLIDADAQGSLTASLGVREPDSLEYTLSTVMSYVINDESFDIEKGIFHHEEGVDLMPGNIELSGMEISLVNIMSREYVLREYIDTTDFDSSMHYNPFAYLRSEKDIMKLITILMANTTGDKQASSDPFWENAERPVYMAYIGYIYYECIEEEQNFGTLVDMINASETREDDEDFKNAIDLIFEELEQEEPNHFAVRQYRKLKLSAGAINYKRFLIQSFDRQPMAA